MSEMDEPKRTHLKPEFTLYIALGVCLALFLVTIVVCMYCAVRKRLGEPDVSRKSVRQSRQRLSMAVMDVMAGINNLNQSSLILTEQKLSQAMLKLSDLEKQISLAESTLKNMTETIERHKPADKKSSPAHRESLAIEGNNTGNDVRSHLSLQNMKLKEEEL